MFGKVVKNINKYINIYFQIYEDLGQKSVIPMQVKLAEVVYLCRRITNPKRLC